MMQALYTPATHEQPGEYNFNTDAVIDAEVEQAATDLLEGSDGGAITQKTFGYYRPRDIRLPRPRARL